MNPEPRPDPTQDEIVFLLRHGYKWVSEDNGNQWLFKKDGKTHDLSASDIFLYVQNNSEYYYHPVHLDGSESQ